MGMSEVIESTNLILHILLTLLGVFTIVLILKVYGLYRTMKINRSVMTPMLLAGLFTAFSGIAALVEPYVSEVGHFVHETAMLLTVVFFVYGIYGYHKMLNRLTKLH